MQNCRISSAFAMNTQQSCAKSAISHTSPQALHHVFPRMMSSSVTEVLLVSPLHSHMSHSTSHKICSSGVGLLSQFPPFRYFPNFSGWWKRTLAIEYHVYIWQVSPQLSCGDTCQIWMWFKESNRYFCKIENFAYGEINEQSFSNPDPCYALLCCGCVIASYWGMDYEVKSTLNSMLVNKDFLTWLLIGWWLCSQSIRCQVWKSLLTNMDFNMEIP